MKTIVATTMAEVYPHMDQLSKLSQALGRELGTLIPTNIPSDFKETNTLRVERTILKRKLSDCKSFYMYMGFDDNEDLIAYMLVIEPSESDRKNPTLWITGVYVKPRYRSDGIASVWIEDMEETAKAAKFKALNLRVLETNPRALKLYEELGFQTFVRSMVKPL